MYTFTNYSNTVQKQLHFLSQKMSLFTAVPAVPSLAQTDRLECFYRPVKWPVRPLEGGAAPGKGENVLLWHIPRGAVVY